MEDFEGGMFNLQVVFEIKSKKIGTIKKKWKNDNGLYSKYDN